MAKEALYIPEQYLGRVIDVIRAGLEAEKPEADIADGLLKWCKDEEEYLRRVFTKKYWPKRPTKAMKR